MAAQLLLESVRDFFKTDQANFDVLWGLRNRGRADNDQPSLRVIDHLVTRFARERGVCYDVPGSDIPVHLYLAHRAELDRYGKAHIDPFARTDKHQAGKEVFVSPNGDGRQVIATAKQLNFIRWAIRNRVIDYATAYLSDIRANLPAAAKKKRARSTAIDSMNKHAEKKPKPAPPVCNDARVHVGDFRVVFDFRDHCSAPAAK